MSEPTAQQDIPAVALDSNEGDLAIHSPDAVLAFCEVERFTGTLRFESRAVSGNLPILRGVPEVPESDRPLERAFEAFLAATEGRYVLEEFLPDLDGATRTGDASFTGTLGPVTIADLLRYASAVGLTGVLLLSRPDRGVVLRHRRGELVSISVNDESDADLVTLFAWTEGRFAIRTRSLFGRVRHSDHPGQSLNEIEVALTDVLARAGDRAVSAPPSAGVPGPSVLRAKTLPFGLTQDHGVRDSSEAQVKPDEDRWEPSAATTGRLRALASLRPPPSPDGTVKIYRVERDPTGAFPAVRVSETPPAPTRAQPPPAAAGAAARHPGTVTARSAAVALRQARTMIFVLGGLLVVTALLAAFLLGRVSK